MQRHVNVAARGDQADVELIELTVVLVANGVDPTMINPDFLRYEEIVDRDLPITEQPFSTPVLSQVNFKDGITVTAEPNRFQFMQQGEPLSEDSCVVPEIAQRFLSKILHLQYSAIGINAKVVRPSSRESVYSVTDALVDGGQWMAFNGVMPIVGLRAVYSYEDKRISMNIDDVKKRNSDSSESYGLLFHTNVHRNIAETDPQEHIERIKSILSGWRDDISDFRVFVEKFNPRRGEL